MWLLTSQTQSTANRTKLIKQPLLSKLQEFSGGITWSIPHHDLSKCYSNKLAPDPTWGHALLISTNRLVLLGKKDFNFQSAVILYTAEFPLVVYWGIDKILFSPLHFLSLWSMWLQANFHPKTICLKQNITAVCPISAVLFLQTFSIQFAVTVTRRMSVDLWE